MALVTLSDIRQYVYDRGFESDSADRITRLANAAVREAIGDRLYDFMRASTTIALVAGTDTYAVPTTSPPVMYAESLRIADVDYVEQREPGELLDAKASGGADWYTGRAWALIDPTSILVYPAPTVAATATLRYFKSPVDMSGDTDEPPIPVPYRDLIVASVCGTLAGRQRQWDAKREFAEEARSSTAAMNKRHTVRRTQTSQQVQESGQKSYSGRGLGGWGGLYS